MATLHKAAELRGLYCLSNKILGGLCLYDLPKAPKYSNLIKGKPIILKIKGKSIFARSSIFIYYEINWHVDLNLRIKP